MHFSETRCTCKLTALLIAFSSFVMRAVVGMTRPKSLSNVLYRLFCIFIGLCFVGARCSGNLIKRWTAAEEDVTDESPVEGTVHWRRWPFVIIVATTGEINQYIKVTAER